MKKHTSHTPQILKDFYTENESDIGFMLKSNKKDICKHTLYGVILRKFLPFIPLIGIPLAIFYHNKFNDTGLENNIINFLSAFLQAISIFVFGYLYL